jgi:oligopeptide transport system permease protein
MRRLVPRLPPTLALVIDRLLWSLPVLWLVATLTFGLMHLVPGGPFDKDKSLPPEIKANVEAKYQLDQPLLQQYLGYLGRLARGDLGPSYKYLDRDVNAIIRDSFPVSMQLGAVAFVIAVVMGVGAGLLAALRPGSWIDRAGLVAATIGFSLPSFVLAILLIVLFAHAWHLFPPALWEGARSMVLPALALGIGPAAYLARLTRSSLLDVGAQEFVRVGRAKGLPRRTLLVAYLLKAGLLPVVTVLGPLMAVLVTGSFVIEYLFSIPGMGRFFITAVTNRDYPLIMGVTLVYAAVIVVANLLVDLLYGWLDPRVRAP